MQSYLPLKETADITSGCHMAVGSTILLSGWDHYLSWGRNCVFFLFFFFNPWTDSVPDVQWMLQKGFNSQLGMSVTSQTPTQVGTISSTSLTYRHFACNFTDSMIGTFVHVPACDMWDSSSRDSATAVHLCPAQPSGCGLACRLGELCPVELCSTAAVTPVGPCDAEPKSAFFYSLVLVCSVKTVG